MQRRVGFVSLSVVAVLVAGIFVIAHSTHPPSAGASATTTSTIRTSFSAFYLDVGASASLGFQPTGIVGNNGRRTSDGYANDLVLMEGRKGVALSLLQIGCPGETAQSMISAVPINNCYKAPQSQLRRAKEILRSKHNAQGVVTVDLGFNNIRTCFSPSLVNETCVNTAIAQIRTDVPKVMNALKSVAGANVHFIGLEYGDPYLSYFEDGVSGPAIATASLVDFNRLNAVLHQVYSAAGAAVANVPAFFSSNITTRESIPNVGTIPVNVAQVCLLTWMCYSQPFGPDDHPNDAGYALIAQAIQAQLPSAW